MPVELLSSISDGSIAVLLMTEPSGARFPIGKHTVGVKPRACARSAFMITSSGSTPSTLMELFAQRAPPLALFPPVQARI